MDNQDHKVEFLNELSQEFERDPDADGIEVRPTTLQDLLDAAAAIDYKAIRLIGAAYRLGLNDGFDCYSTAIKPLGGAK